MISYLKGTIKYKTSQFVVVDVNGVGYQVFCGEKTLSSLGKSGEEVDIYTTLFVRDDALKLYGFEDLKELELFDLLVGVSGIGPRAAQAIIGIGTPEQIIGAIEKGEEKFFKGIYGVGSKKIKKIILELSGKLPQKEMQERMDQEPFRDAQRALVSLGFSSQEVKETLRELPQDLEDSKEMVRQALRLLGRH